MLTFSSKIDDLRVADHFSYSTNDQMFLDVIKFALLQCNPRFLQTLHVAWQSIRVDLILIP